MKKQANKTWMEGRILKAQTGQGAKGEAMLCDRKVGRFWRSPVGTRWTPWMPATRGRRRGERDPGVMPAGSAQQRGEGPQVMLLGWLSRGDLPHSMRTKVSRVETGFPPSVSS